MGLNTYKYRSNWQCTKEVKKRWGQDGVGGDEEEMCDRRTAAKLKVLVFSTKICVFNLFVSAATCVSLTSFHWHLERSCLIFLDNINPTVFNRPETLITDSNWFKLLAYWEHNNELCALIRGAVVTSGHCSWCSECVRLNTECCCAGIDHCLHVEIRFLCVFFLCNTGKNTNHWSSNLTPFHPE